jgi:phage-related minor tail protein
MTALQKMINWFSGLSPGAQKAILAIGGFLIILGPVLVILGGLISAIGAIITFLTGPAIAAIGGAIAAAAPVIAVVVGIIAAVALLKTAWENNWGGIQEKTAVVVDWIKGKVQAFLDAIQAFWDKHGAKITEVVTKIWDGIKRVFDIFFGFIQGIVDTFLLILQGDFKGAGENLRETFINTWQKIKSLFSDLLKGIINTFKNIDWAQLGRDIINGIINGLKNAAQWLYNTISNIAGGVIDFAKGILGIESPSKVFAEIGEQINKGMALGIKATVDLPESALSIPGVRSVTSMPAQTRGDAELAKLFGIDYERMALIIRDAVMQVQR